MGMDIGYRRAAVTLAVLAAVAFWASRTGRRPATEPAAAASASVSAAPAPVRAKTAQPQQRPVTVAKGPPTAPREERGAGLREPGEALGGTPPMRVDRSTPTAQ